MVALALILLPVLFVMGLLTTNFAVQTKSEGVVDAAHAGEMVLERWKARPFAEVQLLLGAPPLVTQELVGSRLYDCSLTVMPLTPSGLNPVGDVLVLGVEVTWRNQAGLGDGGTRQEQLQSTTLTSVISPGGSL